MKRFVTCGICLALLVACEPPKTRKSGDVSGTGTITVFGQLVSGSAVRLIQEGITRPDPITRSDDTVRSADVTGTGKVKTEGAASRTPAREPVGGALGPGAPLPGLTLYCVTLQDPPQAGSGTAGADGTFALEIDAAGIPFGCFVVDPSAQRVADLLFVGDKVLPSGQHEVSGVGVFDQDQNLGQVWVDASTKLALAASPAETTGTPSTDTEMWDPSGRWEAVECLDLAENKGCSTKELYFYTGWYYENPFNYFNRVAGRDVSTGERRFFLDQWDSEESFVNCGRTEGLTNEKAREVYGIDLDPEVNTAPFSFLSEPPGPNSWDPDGSCSGWVDPKLETGGRCIEAGDPGVRAYCYYYCWVSRAMDPKFTLCTRYRDPDIDKAGEYLVSLQQGENPVFEPDKYFTFKDVPLASYLWLSEETRLDEMTYSNADTWSTTFTTINNNIPISVSGQLHYCDTVFLSQYSATHLREGEALGTVALSFNISQTSKDFDSCSKNSDLILTSFDGGLPIELGESVRLRERLRRAP